MNRKYKEDLLASLYEIEDAVSLLMHFQPELAEEIEKLKETRSAEVRVALLKKIQLRMFELALKLPFTYKGH